MCLIVDIDLTRKLVSEGFNEDGLVIVYKFMLQDSQGNIWSPKFGGKMVLDENGYYVSDRDPSAAPPKNGKDADKGIHVLLEPGVDFILETIKQMAKGTNVFQKKWGRPLNSKFVKVEFIAHKNDFVAAGTNIAFGVHKNLLFNKIKFIRILPS